MPPGAGHRFHPAFDGSPGTQDVVPSPAFAALGQGPTKVMVYGARAGVDAQRQAHDGGAARRSTVRYCRTVTPFRSS